MKLKQYKARRAAVEPAVSTESTSIKSAESVGNGGDFLDVWEAASFLHVADSTVRAWVLKRCIPFHRLGGRVFFRRADLEALIERGRVPAKITSESEGKKMA